ncbi:hypothetical protein CPLU01_10893 [Colletotrichum plurivorum]|uniref:Uncharacterized protein n=1 Tax=Colletotrichum plurivorum TaxID=2175906 RepID=A0A8H6K462_9PEZI|nr:hypothetical protein CPLU01_10893 [Colletotrichum plurivorum]
MFLTACCGPDCGAACERTSPTRVQHPIPSAKHRTPTEPEPHWNAPSIGRRDEQGCAAPARCVCVCVCGLRRIAAGLALHLAAFESASSLGIAVAAHIRGWSWTNVGGMLLDEVGRRPFSSLACSLRACIAGSSVQLAISREGVGSAPLPLQSPVLAADRTACCRHAVPSPSNSLSVCPGVSTGLAPGSYDR